MDECPTGKTSEKLGFLVRFPRVSISFFVFFLGKFLGKNFFFFPFQLDFFFLGVGCTLHQLATLYLELSISCCGRSTKSNIEALGSSVS